MRRSFGIAALAAGILSVSACGPAGGGPEAPALQEESRETEGTQETKVIQETEDVYKRQLLDLPIGPGINVFMPAAM